MAAADRGDLHDKTQLAQQVDRMLASPRLDSGVRAFFDDMLGFDAFDSLAKDPAIYPEYTGSTAADAREETLRFVVDELVTQGKSYRDLFTTRSTVVSRATASLYNMPVSAPSWTRAELPDSEQRAGLLTRIGFLSLYSHEGRSSPTLRGKAIREKVLCQAVPAPPPNVDFSAVNDPKSPLKTARERLTFHQQNAVCAGCHKITDPIGLALENFDSAGRYRATEGGMAIDASGSLDGHAFRNAEELGQAVAGHPSLASCLVNQLYAYAVGDAVKPEDRPLMNYMAKKFSDDGYRLRGLLRSIVLDDAFSTPTASDSPSAVNN